MNEWKNLIDIGQKAAASGKPSVVEVVVPKASLGQLAQGQKDVMGGDKDFVVIEQRLPGHENIFYGKEYFGEDKKFTKNQKTHKVNAYRI